MSLPEPLHTIGREILHHFQDRTSAPPYSLYVYEPEEELAVRREMQDLRAYLTANGANVAAVSLAQLFWSAVEESGFYDSIVESERASPNDGWVLQQVRESLHEILNEPPTLADRVIAKVDGQPERTAVLLYRAGALYPVFRTSALLDDMRERLRRPVVLLYPGHTVDPFGLRFMGKSEPIHGYRAKIYQRSAL